MHSAVHGGFVWFCNPSSVGTDASVDPYSVPADLKQLLSLGKLGT